MFIFTPWRKFGAYRDRKVTTLFMKSVAKEAEDRLKEGILEPPKTGRLYRRRRGLHQASINIARAEYPANDTGRLVKSVRNQATSNSATVGTTIYYGRFLREGTKKMKRRRMSDDALRAIIPRARAKLRGWIGWRLL